MRNADLKALLANPVLQFLIGRAIGLYMLLVGATTHWTRVNQAAVEPFWRGEGKVIACIWHGRFMLVHKFWMFGRDVPKAKMLISQSREGGIVAHASRTVGAEVIRGSASKGTRTKGGAEALRAMARHIEEGGVIGMTPDGPRGPRMRAKRAPAQLAKLAGAQLLPLAWSSDRRVVMKSWDRMLMPLPFGRGALVWGTPLPAPAPDASDAEIEALTARLEAEMNRIAAEADRVVGVAPIEPAPVTGPTHAEAATSAP